jgi:hypothetical protein
VIVEHPEPTDAYRAIASALRPHSHADRIDLTFQHIVGLAAKAVDDMVAGLRAEVAAAQEAHAADVDALGREVEQRRREMDARVAAAETTAAEASARVASDREWDEQESRRVAERLAALEELAVQARARWAHEGGPSLLRDALERVGA